MPLQLTRGIREDKYQGLLTVTPKIK
jgi:hypothetical protein